MNSNIIRERRKHPVKQMMASAISETVLYVEWLRLMNYCAVLAALSGWLNCEPYQWTEGRALTFYKF